MIIVDKCISKKQEEMIIKDFQNSVTEREKAEMLSENLDEIHYYFEDKNAECDRLYGVIGDLVDARSVGNNDKVFSIIDSIITEINKGVNYKET